MKVFCDLRVGELQADPGEQQQAEQGDARPLRPQIGSEQSTVEVGKQVWRSRECSTEFGRSGVRGAAGRRAPAKPEPAVKRTSKRRPGWSVFSCRTSRGCCANNRSGLSRVWQQLVDGLLAYFRHAEVQVGQVWETGLEARARYAARSSPRHRPAVGAPPDRRRSKQKTRPARRRLDPHRRTNQHNMSPGPRRPLTA